MRTLKMISAAVVASAAMLLATPAAYAAGIQVSPAVVGDVHFDADFLLDLGTSFTIGGGAVDWGQV